jgi:hypothetical protein
LKNKPAEEPAPQAGPSFPGTGFKLGGNSTYSKYSGLGSLSGNPTSRSFGLDSIDRPSLISSLDRDYSSFGSASAKLDQERDSAIKMPTTVGFDFGPKAPLDPWMDSDNEKEDSNVTVQDGGASYEDRVHDIHLDDDVAKPSPSSNADILRNGVGHDAVLDDEIDMFAQSLGVADSGQDIAD